MKIVISTNKLRQLRRIFMKKGFLFLFLCLFGFALTACAEETATTSTERSETSTTAFATMTDQALVERAHNALQLGNLSDLTEASPALVIPQTISVSEEGIGSPFVVPITWEIDHPEIISATGVIHQPDHETGDVTVTLTATITSGSVTQLKVFTATVLALPGSDDFDYNALSFPSFSAMNPVRYLEKDLMGNDVNGWQDFGLTGEIKTHPWARTTYTYQMYSYFLRNNLQDLFAGVTLPEELDDLPEWFADTEGDGHRVLWFSMGAMPTEIRLIRTESLVSTNGIQTFLCAEYEITVNDVQQPWIVYFMETEGTFSSYAVRVNEMYDFVKSTTDFIVQTYQLKA